MSEFLFPAMKFFTKLSCQIPSVVEGILTRRLLRVQQKRQVSKREPEELQQSSLRLISDLRSADATGRGYKNTVCP